MLYKIKDVDDKVHFIFIVAENVRVAGNAIGLTGAGLIKIKRTDTEGYAYVR